jgi:hypothetical protein
MTPTDILVPRLPPDLLQRHRCAVPLLLGRLLAGLVGRR